MKVESEFVTRPRPLPAKRGGSRQLIPPGARPKATAETKCKSRYVDWSYRNDRSPRPGILRHRAEASGSLADFMGKIGEV